MAQQGDQFRPSSDDGRAAEQILQAVTQDLKSLRQGLIAQLSEEVAWLKTEKARLQTEIQTLQAQHQALQADQIEALSRQQIDQQQLWAKQLAQILAHHLQALMVQRLNQIAGTNSSGTRITGSGVAANGYSENAHRLLASLDSTFSDTFRTLQRELNSYQSSLSQQLNRMHSMEQQGEAILDALINRLREQLQTELVKKPQGIDSAIASNGYPSAPPQPTVPLDDASPSPKDAKSLPPEAKPIPLSVPGAPLPFPKQKKKELSNFQLGLILVLLSTAALSFHNVVVGIIYRQNTILHLFNTGGFLKASLGNSLLILWFRMLVVLPLMVPVAMFLYPSVWRDIRKFVTAPERRPLLTVVGSGAFLFLSQVLVYISIPSIGPGPAVTILFMYPLVTVPLAWFLFGDRPTRLRWIVMVMIFLGVVLTSLPKINWSQIMTGGAGGILIAICSGIAFAFYLIFMQIGFKKLHPIPVTLIQFFTIFILTSFILLLSPNLSVRVDQPVGFYLSTMVLGILTLVGYLTNNFGVRFMGAARASIFASSGPVMTAILAWLIISEQLKSLSAFGIDLPVQALGILLVTLGVTALSFERMKASQPTKPAAADGRR